VQSGVLGKVTHAVLVQPGGGLQERQPEQAPPPELDWEMWQGPAPHRPYSPMYRRWRAFYAYGGGLVTDWGVHLTDVALMYLNADNKGPLLTSVSAQYINAPRDLEQVPNSFVCSWQYDDFVMSFTNAVANNPEWGLQGDWFYGPRGTLQVHRSGYRVYPAQQRATPGGPPPLEAKTVPIIENYENDPYTTAHARNFLDCIKSRKRPVSDIEIGFHVTLPCLIALLAIQQGRSFAWDGKAAKAV